MSQEAVRSIKLVRYTENPEQVVAFAAKLCYSELDNDDLFGAIEGSDVTRFIRMLNNMGHLSPTEHASFTFALEGVSRALLAQITRHRIASFSVRSQRYVSGEQFDYIIPPAIKELGEGAEELFRSQMSIINDWYIDWQARLGKGEKGNEDARFVLPNACETKILVTMNARELIHFFSLRCCNRAQWEIREVAWQMLAEVLKVAPALFEKAGPGCVSGACPEGKMSCARAAEIIAKRKELTDTIPFAP